MLSRVAQRIYWMARYLERAENTARLINVNTHLLLDLPKGSTLGWAPLTEIMGSNDLFDELYTDASERNIIKFLSADLKNPSSITSCIYFARENARTIRDIIPVESWEAINELYDCVKEKLPNSLARKNRFPLLRNVIEQVQMVSGIQAGTMLRGNGYHFLKLGRYLERADMTSRILDVRSENLLEQETGDLPPFEHIQWVSVLNSLSAYQSYRQQVRGVIRSSSVLQFLLRNHQFPRSFAHCMGEAKHCLNNLPHSHHIQKHVTRIIEQLDSLDMSKIKDESLYILIDQLQVELATLDNEISEIYFSLEREIKTEKFRELKLVENE